MRSSAHRGRRSRHDTEESDDAEKGERISERRFNEFFATLPVYCYVISPAGHILDVNPAACKALGYSKESLVGKPLSVIYAPESHLRMKELIASWKKNGRIRDEEMVIVTNQGEKRTVLFNVGSVFDSNGRLLHSTSAQIDITDRKRIEEKVREAQERLTDSVASMMEAIEVYSRPGEQVVRDTSDEPAREDDRLKLQNLTKREREILHLLMCGVSTKRISQLLDVHLSTVRNHIQNLFSKLGVHNRLECVILAQRFGFELRKTAGVALNQTHQQS